MKLLLISEYFWPESFGAGVWLLEMCEHLVQRGHEVTVLTGFPHHPEGVIHIEYRGRWFQREQYKGINIIRTWLYATPRTEGLLPRVLSQASFALTCLPAGLVAGLHDVVLYMSPPLPGALSSWIISIVHRAPLVISIQDIEPERSVSLGLFRNPGLIRLLQTVERFAYGRAARICALSEGARQRLTERGAAAEKIRITPNWANGKLILPLPASQSMRRELGLNGAFVVLYSGNMGYTMDLETVVESAYLLRDDHSIKFLLAGDGVKRAAVERQARGARNVKFLPLQPRSRFPKLLAAADIGLVLVSREATHVSVPGKTYSIMAAGRPVLAVCDPANDTARVVREAGCGAQVMPGDAKALTDVIRTYRDDSHRVAREGERARAYFDQHFAVEECVSRYEQILCELAK